MNATALSPLGLILLLTFSAVPATTQDSALPENFQRENLVAWCIVPFDAKQRDSATRANMVKKLGLRRVAYDWRDVHLPEFESEILAYKENGIEFFAFWKGHETAYPLIARHGIKPQIWHSLQTGKGLSNKDKITSAAESLIPLAIRTGEAGLSLGLYGHGGWGGLPDNLVAVCKTLREKGFNHVGIVYNFHHAHPRIESFESDLRKMKPFLFCLNLNGMADPAVDDVTKKEYRVKTIGSGAHEKEMIETVIASGYSGPLGIIGHVATRDVEEVLRENLEGLDRILAELVPLQGSSAVPVP
jgi:hypothetical protein